MHKKIVPNMVIFLMVILTLSVFLVQLSPVSAQDQAASLTGTIYDEGVDTDGDGYFDYLNFGVEVNVTSAATYIVDAGGIYDATINFIPVQSNNSIYLDVGVHVVYLAMNGTEIYASTVNPTTIASIFLFDEANNTLGELHDLALPTTYTYDNFQRPIIEILFEALERDIILDQTGSIYVTNAYLVTPMGFWVKTVELGFPEGAYSLELRDEMGTLETTTENNVMTVTLRNTLDENETETLYLNYRVPWNELISQQNGLDYSLDFTFYEQFNSTIETLTVSIILPKGADFQSSSTLDPETIEKTDLQETITFSLSNVSPSDDLNFEINYKYNVFWGSFYPTMWVGIIAIAASAVFFFWGAPKIITVPTIQVPPKHLKSFVDVCEEKIALRSELEALDERLHNGKIPRRRYKVRKKMLDGRLSSVSRTLSSLRETLRASGSKYANLMRQLEVAEAKLEGTEKDLQRVNSRYRRGEISKGAYGKLVEDYQSRIADAESTIDGVLLRLRD